MGRADGNAEAGFPLWNRRIAYSRDKKPPGEQFFKSLHGFLLIPDDHRKNRGLGFGKVESKFR